MRETQLPRKPIACSLVLAFLLYAFNLALTDSDAQTGTLQVSIAGTAVGSVPHQIDLKVTQLPGGQLSQLKGFVVGPEDVVQVKLGENIVLSTSPDLQVHKVTLTNVEGISLDLAPLRNNVWSLQGLSPGLYMLDVNAAMSSSGFLGTYETMLAILEPNQQPLPPASIISQITVEESAVCPSNLILANGNCVEPTPKPPLPSYPGPTPRPTDYCSRILLPPEEFKKYCEDEGVGKGERPICTPNGPPCPPCPEGVEAGWCADEDERQDVDDCLNEQGEERFPGCSNRDDEDEDEDEEIEDEESDGEEVDEADDVDQPEIIID